MTFKRAVFYIVVLILLVVVGYSIVHKTAITPTVTPPVAQPVAAPIISSANYSCDNNATIAANYTATSAMLTLSDGRQLTLPQIVSADGAQYQSGTILFVTKGDQAFLEENGSNTFNNCLAGSTAVGTNGLKSFTDQGKTFTFNYPQGFTLAGGGIGYTENWKVNTDSTLGLILATVNVPQSYQPGTNFSDAKFTVGTSSDPAAVKACLSNATGPTATKSTATINGLKYTVLSSTDAAAGNRYETTSYRIIQNSQCYAIEYTIHYAVLQNFDPSSGITAFDEKKVHNALDSIVQSFTFLPQSPQ